MPQKSQHKFSVRCWAKNGHLTIIQYCMTDVFLLNISLLIFVNMVLTKTGHFFGSKLLSFHSSNPKALPLTRGYDNANVLGSYHRGDN